MLSRLSKVIETHPRLKQSSSTNLLLLSRYIFMSKYVWT